MVQAFRRCYVEVISTEFRYNTEDVKNPHLINNVPTSEWRVENWQNGEILEKWHTNKMMKFLLIMYFHGTMIYVRAFAFLIALPNC